MNESISFCKTLTKHQKRFVALRFRATSSIGHNANQNDDD